MGGLLRNSIHPFVTPSLSTGYAHECCTANNRLSTRTGDNGITGRLPQAARSHTPHAVRVLEPLHDRQIDGPLGQRPNRLKKPQPVSPQRLILGHHQDLVEEPLNVRL